MICHVTPLAVIATLNRLEQPGLAMEFDMGPKMAIMARYSKVLLKL
jgi:hypothetical protein